MPSPPNRNIDIIGNCCKCCCRPLQPNKMHMIFDLHGRQERIQFLMAACQMKYVCDTDGSDQAICSDCLHQLKSEFAARNPPKPNIELNSDAGPGAADAIKDPPMTTTNTDDYADHGEIEALSCHSEEWILGDVESDTQQVLENESNGIACTLFSALSAQAIREHIQRDVELHPIHQNPLTVDDDEDNGGMVIEYLDETNEELPNAIKKTQIKSSSYGDDDNDTQDNARSDFDEYLMRVVVVSFNEKNIFKNPSRCSQCRDDEGAQTLFVNFSDLLRHTSDHYDSGGEWVCCLGNSDHRRSFDDETTLRNHWFLEHNDIVNICVSFKCPTCSRQFSSAVQFGKHICRIDAVTSASSSTTVVCEACPLLSFTTHRRWQFHMLHRHGQPGHIRRQLCLACGLSLADDQRFYEHVQFEHERYQLCVCRTCDRCFTNATECAQHQQRHTWKRPFKCLDCDASFAERSHLSKHQSLHRSERFQCKHCDKSFKRSSVLRQHINRQHTEFDGQRLPLCSACGEVFTGHNTDAEEKCHSACPDTLRCSAHFTELFCCEFCERSFATVAQLCTHRNRPHTSIKVASTSQPAFTCSLCLLSFDTFGKRSTHSRVHRCDPRLPSATCIRRSFVCAVPECVRIFGDWPTLQHHRKTVHLIQPTVMRCHECEMVFYQSWRLAHHRRAVHAERLRCPICPATFVLQSSLNVHLRRAHIEDKPIVDVRRYRDGLIDQFFRIEPEDGSFTCVKCGKNSTLRKNAITHAQAVHLRIREFGCDRCERRFFSKGDMRKHYKRRHYTEHMDGSVVGSKEPKITRITPIMLECWYCGHREHSKSKLTTHLLENHR